MVAAEGKYAESAQQIEIAVAVSIDQVRTFASDVIDIVADRLQHANELGIEISVVEGEFLGMPRLGRAREDRTSCRVLELILAPPAARLNEAGTVRHLL